MSRLGAGIGRLLPTVLMVVGITFLTAGLLSFASPTTDGPRGTAAATASVPSAIGTQTAGSATPAFTLPPRVPVASRLPSPPGPGEPPARATRIRIPTLNIDLPVVPGDLLVPGNDGGYPLCDVAMFLPEFVQPGELGTTYIYAHAQPGMFLPLLTASEVNEGASLVGTLVEVYTADAQVHVYDINRVKRHATDLTIAETLPGVHQLVLQTSEGPAGTVPKLQIAARSLSVAPVAPAEALPSAAPRVCLPD